MLGRCPGWDGGAPLARKMGEQSKSRVMRADSCGPTAPCHPSLGIAPGNYPQKPPRANGPIHHAARSDIHAARMMGRAVGAEYRFESISWGDAPGWDGTGALPLKSHVGAMPGPLVAFADGSRGSAPETHPQKPPRANGPIHHAARRDIRRIERAKPNHIARWVTPRWGLECCGVVGSQ